MESLQQIIDKSNKIVFFTGAGVSVNSGIPDFRSSNGLYNTNLSAEEMLSHHYFVSNTKQFFQFYKNNMLYPNAKPNAAHLFMAKCEQKGKALGVITQNIDGLHQAAGSKNVIELHGSVQRNYCTNCHSFYDLQTIINAHDIPYCPKCNSIIKPDVVLYEESLNNNDIENAINMLQKADTLIVTGTSLMVYPAASFVRYFYGDNLIIINKQETQADQYANLAIHDDVGKVLSSINI